MYLSIVRVGRPSLQSLKKSANTGTVTKKESSYHDKRANLKTKTITSIATSSSVTDIDQRSLSSSTPLKQSHSSSTPLKQSHSSSTPLKQPQSSSTPLKQSQTSSTPMKQTQSSSTPLKQSHSHSPRKGRNSKTDNKTEDVGHFVFEQDHVPLSKLNVPPEERGDLVYKNVKNKNLDSSEIVKVENKEIFRQRGKLRPLRKSSHSSNIDFGETEEETTENSTEEEYEIEDNENRNEDTKNGQRRKTNKEDVVHCGCGDNVDEGFMIQVSNVGVVSLIIIAIIVI